MAEGLNIRIHNPNTDAATAAYLIKLFMEVNEEKVNEAIAELFSADKLSEGQECDTEFAQIELNA